MKYIKQLDAIRALAILSVLCNHSLPTGHWLNKASGFIEAPDIFFALSGFLITTILLKARNLVALHKTSRLKVFKNFFAKRILRIFPAYYLTILVVYLAGVGGTLNYTSYLNFTANIAIHQNQEWSELAHLWSMSVEQQFYLIWPFVIILTPRKLLLPSILLFIGIGLYSRQAMPATDFNLILPQTCFDALGWGAVLAWAITYKYNLLNTIYKVTCAAAIISVALLAAEVVFENSILVSNHRTFLAIITTWLITYFIYHEKQNGGMLGRIFNNNALILIGKMSYGIYLYHLSILINCYKLLDQLNTRLSLYAFFKNGQYLILIEDYIIIFLLAWLSWRYFEVPLYTLSKYFADTPKSKPTDAPFSPLLTPPYKEAAVD
jgi:peptidoglycan/LPS O-acetylase OafA/YrhL